jgi:hypothetical protein
MSELTMPKSSRAVIIRVDVGPRTRPLADGLGNEVGAVLVKGLAALEGAALDVGVAAHSQQQRDERLACHEDPDAGPDEVLEPDHRVGRQSAG